VSQEITPRENYPIDLLKQYNLFYERMSPGKNYSEEWNSNNTLFAMYMGSNDVFDVKKVNNTKTMFENLNDVLDVIYITLENIYEVGGRNFLILNVAPFYYAPINAQGNKYEYVFKSVPYFNYFLRVKANKLFKNHDDVNVIFYDLHAEYLHIMDQYANYGFKFKDKAWKIDNKKYKKKNQVDLFFWRDFTHISNKANKILAEDIHALLESTTN